MHVVICHMKLLVELLLFLIPSRADAWSRFNLRASTSWALELAVIIADAKSLRNFSHDSSCSAEYLWLAAQRSYRRGKILEKETWWHSTQKTHNKEGVVLHTRIQKNVRYHKPIPRESQTENRAGHWCTKQRKSVGNTYRPSTSHIRPHDSKLSIKFFDEYTNTPRVTSLMCRFNGDIRPCNNRLW